MSETALPPVESEAERRADLSLMKRRATGLLVIVAVTWVALLVVTDDVGVTGYAIATAEAAMVGALADWFAVTAIFRHPLNLPIPHTAVVAARKDQFGVTLGAFVQENFLSPDVVGDRLRDLDLAGRAGRWLTEPANTDRAASHASGLVVRLAQSATDDDIVSMVEREVRQRAEAVEAGPLLARALRLLTADGHHEALLDELLALLDKLLVDNQLSMRQQFVVDSPWWLPEPLDEAIFNRLFAGVRNLLSDAATPNGPAGLRKEVHLAITRFTDDLESKPDLVARAEEIKLELLDNPELRRWIDGMWTQLKNGLRSQALDDSSQLRTRVAALIAQLGSRLENDPEMRAAVNGFIDRSARSAVEQFSAEIAGLVSNTIAGWDREETADRLELLLGRDLQFIRINGTIVGGLAGLVIHAISQAAG